MVDGGWWLTSGLSQTECGQTQTKGGGECIRGDREGMMKRERERGNNEIRDRERKREGERETTNQKDKETHKKKQFAPSINLVSKLMQFIINNEVNAVNL